MINVWLGAVLFALAIGLLGLTVGAAAGADWGWGVATVGLLLLGTHHLRNLAKLAQWAQAAPGSAVPSGSGVWDWIYSALHRRVRATQSERAELSAALTRFTDAAHAMPDGVIIVDKDDNIEWLNATAQVQFGLSPQADVGYPVTNVVRHPEFVAYLAAGRYAEPLVLRDARAAGHTLSVQVVAFGAEQRLILSRDVSQIERLETMRRDFIANVSHELRTPLTVVSGFIETLADNLPGMSPAEAGEFLRLALEQAQRMQRLVDDLLTLSRLETGSPPPADECVEVGGLLEELARDARALSAGRHVIETDGGAAVTLLGSATELRSAIGNLLSNAVRYTPPGGRIRLSWRAEPAGGGCFVVEDSGIGIDARHLPRLTERFYRVDRGRSRESGGTGLGLAIVKHALSRHQAKLEIHSEPGKGSRFTACFPSQRVQAPSPAAGA